MDYERRLAAFAMRPLSGAAQAAVDAGRRIERRTMQRVLDSPEIERLPSAALDSEWTQAAIRKALASDGAKQLVASLFESGLFDAGTGQTPGSRVMHIRVVSLQGEPIKPVRGVVRCIGLLLAALPLFAGYLMIPSNRHRRGLQDYMASTVVVEAPQLPVADVRRVKFRAAHPPKTVPGDGRQIPPPNPGRSSDSGDDRDSARVQA